MIRTHTTHTYSTYRIRPPSYFFLLSRPYRSISSTESSVHSSSSFCRSILNLCNCACTEFGLLTELFQVHYTPMMIQFHLIYFIILSVRSVFVRLFLPIVVVVIIMIQIAVSVVDSVHECKQQQKCTGK